MGIVQMRSQSSLVLAADAGPLGLEDAFAKCAQLLNERDIEIQGRQGIYGNWALVRKTFENMFRLDRALRRFLSVTPRPFDMFGIHWTYDQRFGPQLIAAWHPSAIIPPATVLRPEGIVHVQVSITPQSTIEG